MFSSTLGIPERTLTDWLKDIPKENVGKENTVWGHKEIDTNYLKQWLLEVPCIDSHYCRKTPTYQGKRFIEHKVDIIKKYLHVGHTQMECDSMHSCIERNMKHCDLFKPADLRVLMSTARRTHFHIMLNSYSIMIFLNWNLHQLAQ